MGRIDTKQNMESSASQKPDDGDNISTFKAENNKAQKKSDDKGKQKESNTLRTTTTTATTTAAAAAAAAADNQPRVIAKEEEYELDDDDNDKTVDEDNTNKASTTNSEGVSRRGRWSVERKQILLEGYATIRPFTARYGQVRGKWQALADLVNACEEATMGTLRARSCKDMVDKLLDTYKPLFSEIAAHNTDTKNLFADKLEETAYHALLMNASWSNPRQDEMLGDNVFPTSMQSCRLKRTYDEISSEDDDEEDEDDEDEDDEDDDDDDEQDECLQSEDVHTQTEPIQQQENATASETPLNYLQYLKYLPAIAAALDTIAANCKK